MQRLKVNKYFLFSKIFIEFFFFGTVVPTSSDIVLFSLINICRNVIENSCFVKY